MLCPYLAIRMQQRNCITNQQLIKPATIIYSVYTGRLSSIMLLTHTCTCTRLTSSLHHLQVVALALIAKYGPDKREGRGSKEGKEYRWEERERWEGRGSREGKEYRREERERWKGQGSKEGKEYRWTMGVEEGRDKWEEPVAKERATGKH